MFIQCTKGEKHPKAKLKNYQAIAIVKQSRNGVPAKSLAAMFGVTVRLVEQINAGHRWGWQTMHVRNKR